MQAIHSAASDSKGASGWLDAARGLPASPSNGHDAAQTQKRAAACARLAIDSRRGRPPPPPRARARRPRPPPQRLMSARLVPRVTPLLPHRPRPSPAIAPSLAASLARALHRPDLVPLPRGAPPCPAPRRAPRRRRLRARGRRPGPRPLGAAPPPRPRPPLRRRPIISQPPSESMEIQTKPHANKHRASPRPPVPSGFPQNANARDAVTEV
ncbi:hypothetical protein BDA96_05G027300 [Sorghum bicolor]|uniref:Uncharacterized protein n=1 Tax=Sorghum bicolor TaxID=4558 RepID=A0A921QXQ6_SORBI|nr:hypothetical protein BDA96_05G027300 [Sorghum bicolor]